MREITDINAAIAIEDLLIGIYQIKLKDYQRSEILNSIRSNPSDESIEYFIKLNKQISNFTGKKKEIMQSEAMLVLEKMFSRPEANERNGILRTILYILEQILPGLNILRAGQRLYSTSTNSSFSRTYKIERTDCNLKSERNCNPKPLEEIKKEQLLQETEMKNKISEFKKSIPQTITDEQFMKAIIELLNWIYDIEIKPEQQFELEWIIRNNFDNKNCYNNELKSILYIIKLYNIFFHKESNKKILFRGLAREIFNRELSRSEHSLILQGVHYIIEELRPGCTENLLQPSPTCDIYNNLNSRKAEEGFLQEINMLRSEKVWAHLKSKMKINFSQKPLQKHSGLLNTMKKIKKEFLQMKINHINKGTTSVIRNIK